MGRTSRKRKRKRGTVFSLGCERSFISLTRWMCRNEWKRMSVLELAKFPDTGRGLMARHGIHQGDVLVSIPRSLMVTSATVADSAVGHLLSKNHSFLCQEVLSAFLVWEKHLGSMSAWNDYLETLPNAFSVPLCINKSHIPSFPWFLQDQVAVAQQNLENSFNHVVSCFLSSECNHCQVSVKDIFTWEAFMWGWCCVNTRAVFIDPIHVPSNSLLIKDRNCLALAPYLDMFNHSDTAEVEVGLNIVNNCYEIKTMKSVKRFSEVFINYGPHSNSKLFLEYGFVLPSNVHDILPLQLNHVIEALKMAYISIESEFEKERYFKTHDLLKHLHISCSGLSWNCSVILKILLCKSNDVKIWENISFVGFDKSLSHYPDFKNVRQRIFSSVAKDLSHCQNLLSQKCNSSCCSGVKGSLNPSLDVCLELLHGLLSVLEAGKNQAVDEN